MSIHPTTQLPFEWGKLQSNCEVKRSSRRKLLSQKSSRISLDGGLRDPNRIIEKGRQALLSEVSPQENSPALEILSAKAFLQLSQIAQLENPLILRLLRDLKFYHKARKEQKSFLLQEQDLEKVKEDCLLVSRIIIPVPAERPNSLEEALKVLLNQSSQKINYLKALRINLEKPRSEFGLVDDAILEAIDPHNRGWVVKTTLWAKAFYEFKSKDPEGVKNLQKFFLFVEGYSWNEAIKSTPNLKINTVRYLRRSELEPYRVKIVRHPHEPPLLFKNDTPYDTTDGWAIQGGNGLEIFAFKEGDFFSAKHQMGELHHSSFFAGGVADCEGEIRCTNGQLQYLNLMSGHYKPKREQAKSLLKWLSDHGINLAGIPFDTIELFKISIQIRYRYSSDHWRSRETVFRKHFLVRCLAEDLHRELNEDGAPTPRGCLYNRDSLQKEICQYYIKKYGYHEISLTLPLAICYLPDQAKWEFTSTPAHLDERLTLRAISGPECSGSQSPLGSYIELA